MKKLFYIFAILLAAASCDSFFDIDFQDQANLDEIFAKKLRRAYCCTIFISWM